jgi:Zn-dependent protease
MNRFRMTPALGLAAVLFAGAMLSPLPCYAEITQDVVKIGVLTVFQTYGADYGGKGSMVAAQMAEAARRGFS